MASRRITKRKSPCQDTIFLEVNDNDLSPEHHSNEDSEPECKIMKSDKELLKEERLENFNLESKKFEFIDQISEDPNNKTIPLPSEEPEIVQVCDKTLEANNNGTTDDNVKKVLKDLEEGEVCDNIPCSKNTDTTDSNLSFDSAIHITFGNKHISDLYKFKFIKFLESFVELELIKETDLSITFQRDNLLNPSEWVVLDESFCAEEILPSTSNKTPTKLKKKKAKKKKKDDDDLFVLDTNPSEKEYNSNSLRYSSKFQIEIESKDDSETPQRTVSNQSCFNCGESHSLRDCELPRNFTRINAAKNKFKVQKQGVRYHLEEDQKYGHLVPGKISNALREALGLRKNELPPYIYIMRTLGYPPGWLEEAKSVYSNLDMFDGEGKTVSQKKKKRQALSPEKIIEYPGFNAPPEKHMKDEHYKYRGVPPYSPLFSKDVMIEFYEKQYAAQQDDYEPCEMDMDGNGNGVEEKPIKINPVIMKLQETTELSLPSPSLVELEKEKENLLLALEDNTSSNVITEENTSEEPEKILLSGEDANDNESMDDSIKLTSVEECIDLDNSTDEGISDSERSFVNNSMIKTSVLGTPILKSKSPYSSLPTMDNFTKDVSPVINFENLPNATGKYEQMTEVLQKVRNKMKNLQNCKS